MKKYLPIIILFFIAIISLFLIVKDRVKNRVVNLPLIKNNQLNNKQELETGSIKDKKVSNKEVLSDNRLTLDLTSPTDKSIVSTSKVIVSGKTSPNAEVFVNEKELKADASGNFSVDYELFEGENEIFVAVNDSLGNYAEKSVIVYLETNE